MILDHNGNEMRKSVEPELVAPTDEMMKAWKRLPDGPAQRAPKSLFFDPMTLMYSLGYKDRKFSMTYDVIRKVAQQLSLTSAIVKHRISQVCEFCSPYRLSRHASGLGFEIKHKNPDRPMTQSEKRFAAELEQFILYCGRPRKNQYGDKREDFETFTKKFLRDLLELDQGCFEIVPDRKGRPFEVIPVDGTTIRIAAEDPYMNAGLRRLQNEAIQSAVPRLGARGNWPQYAHRNRRWRTKVSHVQVIRGQIETLYKDGEMAFCIMNPRTDLHINGYGQSNVELLIRVITAHLYAEQHNLNVFKQGSLPKALINIVGEQVDPAMMESFRRQWHSQLTGVQNAFKTPILSGPEVQYIPMQGTNRDQEFNNWINYLIRLHCAVWQIDPAEISFELTASQGQFAPPQYETAAEWKIKKSKDRGLRPLLRYYAYVINKFIIDKVDDHFYLDFVGLDELSQKDRLELRQQEATIFKTINEVRESENLPPLDDGDIVANPTYLQWKQMQMNQEMMEQEQQQGGGEEQPQADPNQEAKLAHEKEQQASQFEHERGESEKDRQLEREKIRTQKQQAVQQAKQKSKAETTKKSFDAELMARLNHAMGYVEVDL